MRGRAREKERAKGDLRRAGGRFLGGIVARGEIAVSIDDVIGANHATYGSPLPPLRPKLPFMARSPARVGKQ